jgi:hypothetical protein
MNSDYTATNSSYAGYVIHFNWGWSSDWCTQESRCDIDTNSMAKPYPEISMLPRQIPRKTTNTIPHITHRDRRTDPRWRAGRWKAKT